MTSVGPMELIVVLAIALIVLGPKRLPEAGRGIGRGIREFKDSLAGDDDHEREPAAVVAAAEHEPAPVSTTKRQPVEQEDAA